MTADPPICRRATLVKPSATLAVAARAGELRAAGHRVLDFSAGEPDFRPPEPVTAAVREQLARSPVGYSPVPGLPALRDLVAEQLGRVHGRPFGRKHVLVSNGGKHSLANLFAVTLEEGDEVAIAAPYWVSYPEMVILAGGVPRIARAGREARYKLRPEQLAEIVGPRTRYFVLNSPSNPTGMGYTSDEIRALGRVLVERAPQAWVLCDDIYRELVYDGYRTPSAFRALDGITDRIVIVDGVSKTYAMTGYRIGFLVAPEHVVSAASSIQGQTTSGAATPSQWAALAALGHPDCPPAVEAMVAAFARRRTLVLDGLRRIPGLSVVPPDGAFYVFVDVSAHVGTVRFPDDVAFATFLLEEVLVATVPGGPFGAPGHLRLSFATDDATLTEGVARIGDAVAAL
jgi:aspartate aminotransferase